MTAYRGHRLERSHTGKPRFQDKKNPLGIFGIKNGATVKYFFQSDALAMLTCCRIYTQPILVLKNLRKIWEQEVQDEETFEEIGTIHRKNRIIRVMFHSNF